MARKGPSGGWLEWLDDLDEDLSPGEIDRLAMIASRVVDHACIRRGDRVLDLGAGKGRMTGLAARAAGSDGTVLAVDASGACLERLGDDLKTDRVKTLKARLDDLPIDSESFDAAVCRSALVYSDSLEEALGELERILVPEGRFSVFEPLPGEQRWSGRLDEAFLEMDRILAERRKQTAMDRLRIREAFRDAGLGSFESLVVHFRIGMKGRSAEEVADEYLYDLPGRLSAYRVLSGAMEEQEIIEHTGKMANLACEGLVGLSMPGIFIWGSKGRSGEKG